MIKIIAIILQIVAVAGGVSLGIFLKSGGSSAHEEDTGVDEASDDEHKEKSPKSENKKKSKSDHKTSKDKSGGHGGGTGGSTGGDSGFMKFGRQFIVPVVGSNGVSALVVLDISLELAPSAKEDIYTREPKIRDALLTSLLTLSNEGAFNERLLQPENIEEIRSVLLSSAETILGNEVTGVLILNVAKQDL